jgi:hypothetical protein
MSDYVQAYGCVECQDWHYEGDAEYEPHLYWQSKHGIEWRPLPEREKIFRAATVGRGFGTAGETEP